MRLTTAQARIFRPGGGIHVNACAGPEECIVLIHQSVPADDIPVE